jgi:expansin (peptidoglycan-binding protein)
LRIRAAYPTLLWALAASLLACHPGGGTHDPGTASPPRTDTSGQCAGICDASPRTYPILGDTGGYGDVTTYGGTLAAPSAGGACNYGPTGILNYAAIQVNRLPGDMQGQWRGGRICGQCVEVRARTPEGWKATVVRIVDKCPDDFCGIDLGGAPAGALMGDKPGRYSGEWSFVSCDVHPGVSDGTPSLFIKEGSNAFWSLVQVRDASERILGIRYRRTGSAPWSDMEWATEAENFYHVPAAVLADSAAYDLKVDLPHGPGYLLQCRGSALAAAGTSLPLTAVP